MSMQTTSQSEPMRIGMVKKPVPALTMEVVSPLREIPHSYCLLYKKRTNHASGKTCPRWV